MASSSEQLASQFSWDSFSKAKDLKTRILFTLGALLVYRLGTHIPMPGVDPTIMAEIFSQQKNSILGVFDMFAGGALQRGAIFALSIVPYISASLIMLLMTFSIPSLQQMQKEGGPGAKKLSQYTRYLAVLIAFVQGYGMCVGAENWAGPHGSAVLNPGAFFRITGTITLVGSTVFLMWLGDQITGRGIGRGSNMIIFAGIVANIPTDIMKLFALGREGAISTPLLLFVIALLASVVFFVVFMERAQRRIPVQYPKRQQGNKVFQGHSTHLPLKVNSSGVLAPIFASALMSGPATFAGFTSASGPIVDFLNNLHPGNVMYMVFYSALIGFFAFFCTPMVIRPDDMADKLRKENGFIPGTRPGKSTADYIYFVLSRITAIGTAYLILVCLLPSLLSLKVAVPFTLGGTGLLIAVTTPMDTMTQIHSHMIAHQYEGLLRKSRLKGSRQS